MLRLQSFSRNDPPEEQGGERLKPIRIWIWAVLIVTSPLSQDLSASGGLQKAGLFTSSKQSSVFLERLTWIFVSAFMVSCIVANL